MNKNKQKTIILIAPQFSSIPFNGGGVEGLLTDLINHNEIEQRCHFVVISAVDEFTKSIPSYSNSTIYYVWKNIGEAPRYQKRVYGCYLFLKCIRKIIFNRLTYKIFRRSEYSFRELCYFGYLCKRVVDKVHPDVIVSFGYDKIHHFWPIIKKYGSKNFYYYLHYCRDMDLESKKLIPNTIAVSQYVLNKWNKISMNGERSGVVLNGVDILRFNYSFDSSTINAKRAELGYEADDFIVLFAGRFRPGKGVLQLLEAFKLIDNDKIKLLMLGDFDSDRHQGENEFENEVSTLIKNNNNIRHLGFIPNNELPIYYACANIQIVPTVYEEAAGMVAIEGMMAGLPLIITKSGGMPEYVDVDCSIQLNIDDDLSQNIALSIKKLFSNPFLCKKMSANSKKCGKRFTTKKYYNDFISFLIAERKLDNELD